MLNNYLLTIILNSMVIDSRELDQDEITIGRDPFNDIVIDNPATSRFHATIYRENGNYIIQDLESSNGTFINNFVTDSKILEVGDEILIGKHILKVNAPKPNGAVIDLAFQSQSKYTGAAEGTFVVDESGRRKLLDKMQYSKYKNIPFLIIDDRKIYIKDGNFCLGKAKGCDIKLRGFFVKNLHAEINKINPGIYKLVSHGNFLSPVKINGKTVKEQLLNNGDIIKLADILMVYNK